MINCNLINNLTALLRENKTPWIIQKWVYKKKWAAKECCGKRVECESLRWGEEKNFPFNPRRPTDRSNFQTCTQTRVNRRQQKKTNIKLAYAFPRVYWQNVELNKNQLSVSKNDLYCWLNWRWPPNSCCFVRSEGLRNANHLEWVFSHWRVILQNGKSSWAYGGKREENQDWYTVSPLIMNKDEKRPRRRRRRVKNIRGLAAIELKTINSEKREKDNNRQIESIAIAKVIVHSERETRIWYHKLVHLDHNNQIWWPTTNEIEHSKWKKLPELANTTNEKEGEKYIERERERENKSRIEIRKSVFYKFHPPTFEMVDGHFRCRRNELRNANKRQRKLTTSWRKEKQVRKQTFVKGKKEEEKRPRPICRRRRKQKIESLKTQWS